MGKPNNWNSEVLSTVLKRNRITRTGTNKYRRDGTTVEMPRVQGKSNRQRFSAILHRLDCVALRALPGRFLGDKQIYRNRYKYRRAV